MNLKEKLQRLVLRYRMIKNHPISSQSPFKAMLRYLSFNIYQLISPKPRIYNWVGGLKFYAEKGDAGIVGNIYYRLMDYEDSKFLLDTLNNEDVFVDVGANLGHYSMLASGICKSKVIAIEPISHTVNKLKKNLELNKLLEKVTILKYGVGDKNEELNFTTNKNVMNGVVKNGANSTTKIKVKTLNHLLKNVSPTCIKIDVEGYEYNVIKGAHDIFRNPSLKYLLIEFNNSGEKFGFHDEDVYQLILDYNFVPVKYDVENKSILPIESYNTHKFNTLFIRKDFD